MRTDQRKEKANKMPKTIPNEETASIASRKANGHLEKHAHSSMTRTRKAMERDGLRSPSSTGSPLRNSQGDGKGGDDGSAQGTRTTLLVTVSQEKRTNCLAQASRKEVAKRNCNYWHVPECTKVRAPGGCRLGDMCAYKHTAKPADEQRNSASIAIHIPSGVE